MSLLGFWSSKNEKESAEDKKQMQQVRENLRRNVADLQRAMAKQVRDNEPSD